MIAKDVKRSRMFHRCLHPQRVVTRDGRVIYVPCRHCAACLNYRSWRLSNMCKREYLNKDYQYPVFVTLTYDNDHLPVFVRRAWVDDDGVINFSPFYINPRNGSIIPVKHMDMDALPFQAENYDVDSRFPEITTVDYFASFDVSDLQKFIKRLRKSLADDLQIKDHAFRYFFVSEYGEERQRPHYHGLFWCKSKEVQNFILSKLDDSNFSDNYARWQFGLSSPWKNGITNASIPESRDGVGKYVAGYITSLSQLSHNFDLRPLRPFYICSKGNIIGYDEGEFRSFERMQDDFASGKISRPTAVYCCHSNGDESVKNVLYSSSVRWRFVPLCTGFNKLTFAERVKKYSVVYEYLLRKGYIRKNKLIKGLSLDVVKRDFSKRYGFYSFDPATGVSGKRFANPAALSVTPESFRELTPQDWHCAWCAVSFVLRYSYLYIRDYVSFVTDYYTSAASLQLGVQIEQYNYCYQDGRKGHGLDYYFYSDLEFKANFLRGDADAILLAKSIGIVLSNRTIKLLQQDKLCPAIENEMRLYHEQEIFYARMHAKTKYTNEVIKDALPDTSSYTDFVVS